MSNKKIDEKPKEKKAKTDDKTRKTDSFVQKGQWKRNFFKQLAKGKKCKGNAHFIEPCFVVDSSNICSMDSRVNNLICNSLQGLQVTMDPVMKSAL